MVASPKTKIFDDVDAGARARLPARRLALRVVSTNFSERQGTQHVFMFILMSFMDCLGINESMLNVDGMYRNT